jgi:hypothetical protein
MFALTIPVSGFGVEQQPVGDKYKKRNGVEEVFESGNVCFA